MAFAFGTTQQRSGTGTQAVTGLGFQPDWLIVLDISYNAINTPYTTRTQTFMGMITAGESFGWAGGFSGSGAAFVTSSTYPIYGPKKGSVIGASDLRISVDSFDVDGFTLDVVLSDTARPHIHWIAGTANNAKILTFNWKGSTGTQSITGAGFQPTHLIGMFPWGSGSSSYHRKSLGFYDGGRELNVGVASSNLSDNQTWIQDSFIYQTQAIGATILKEANVQSLDVDGFTLNYTTANASVDGPQQVLCLDLSDGFACQRRAIPGSTGSEVVDSTELTPEFVTFLGGKNAGTGSISTGNSDSVNDICNYLLYPDASADLGNELLDTGDIIRVYDPASPKTLEVSASLTSLDSDGFTLNWGNIDTGYYAWIAWGTLFDDGIFERSVTSVLSIAQSIDTNIKLESVDSNITIAQALDSNIFMTSVETQLTALQILTSTILTIQELETVLTIAQSAADTKAEAVSHTLSVVQDMYNSWALENVLTISQTIEGAKGGSPVTVLSLASTVVSQIQASRSVSSTLNVLQNLFYEYERDNRECIYSPFVGPDGISATRPTLGSGTFQLTNGVDTVILRNAEMGNTDSMAFQRINRRTRNGKLIVYADPNWPKPKTQQYTIVGLNETQKDEFEAFVDATLGELITITDHHDRDWTGFIKTPDLDITHLGQCNYSISFEFEGELV